MKFCIMSLYSHIMSGMRSMTTYNQSAGWMILDVELWQETIAISVRVLINSGEDVVASRVNGNTCCPNP